ncbi:TetR/AcrR family transcriptional regulator [Mycolicibacterium sp. XJ1819]
MTLLSEPERVRGDELSTIERIRRAALRSIATRGAAATTLRAVAADAGVSLGLVQHHFATKAGLVKAVDEHVMSVVIEFFARPVPAPPEDSLAEMGNRINRLIVEHPDIVDYFGRALIDGSPLGETIFDTLTAFGTTRWNQRKENGELRSDVDLTWATLNALILAVGTLMMRSHVDRQLPDTLTSPEQLARWQDSVNKLLRHGLFRHPGDEW